MRVADIMATHLVSCAPETPIVEVAQLMCDNDCGAIPVLEDGGRPVGILTDRDITCRAVAEGRDVTGLQAAQVMSRAVITVSPDTSIEACCEVMEKNQLRRVVVIDELGVCCGMVAQADLARRAPKDDTVAVVRAVSKPTGRSVSANA